MPDFVGYERTIRHPLRASDMKNPPLRGGVHSARGGEISEAGISVGLGDLLLFLRQVAEIVALRSHHGSVADISLNLVDRPTLLQSLGGELVTNVVKAGAEPGLLTIIVEEIRHRPIVAAFGAVPEHERRMVRPRDRKKDVDGLLARSSAFSAAFRLGARSAFSAFGKTAFLFNKSGKPPAKRR